MFICKDAGLVKHANDRPRNVSVSHDQLSQLSILVRSEFYQHIVREVHCFDYYARSTRHLFHSSSAGLARILHEKDGPGTWQFFVSEPCSRCKSSLASWLATSEGAAAHFSRVRNCLVLFHARILLIHGHSGFAAMSRQIFIAIPPSESQHRPRCPSSNFHPPVLH